MSALRVSVPGREIVFIDLGTGSASTGEVHGYLATPLPTPEWRRRLDERLASEITARDRQRAYKAAWRLANIERLREYDRNRGQKHREEQARYRARQAEKKAGAE